MHILLDKIDQNEVQHQEAITDNDNVQERIPVKNISNKASSIMPRQIINELKNKQVHIILFRLVHEQQRAIYLTF